jgi:hypothetical protein
MQWGASRAIAISAITSAVGAGAIAMWLKADASEMGGIAARPVANASVPGADAPNLPTFSLRAGPTATGKGVRCPGKQASAEGQACG